MTQERSLPSQRVPDEELKLAHGGIAADRSNGAYPVLTGKTADLQVAFSSNFLKLAETVEEADEVINMALSSITEITKSRDVVLVVPMKENGPAITPMLDTVVRLMPSDLITVVNNDSDDAALLAVRRHPDVKLVFADDILGAVRWDKLLPILNLDQRPKGKGVAMLAGYLFQHALAELTGQAPRWLCQHDAEIDLYARYRALAFLLWGLRQRPDAHYLKIAKFGRGNEACMAARSSLAVIASLLDRLMGDGTLAAARARDLFAKLVPHKWMLTGEFLLSWELAMHRFFATGYLEETFCSICAEDIGQRDGLATIHVANPNPRIDAKNDERKEAIMQQQISNFIFRMIGEQPTTEWTIETIAKINWHWMAEPIVMGWIPPGDNPVVAEAIPNDRIIPSIIMLIENGLVDLEVAHRVAARYLERPSGDVVTPFSQI